MINYFTDFLFGNVILFKEKRRPNISIPVLLVDVFVGLGLLIDDRRSLVSFLSID